MAVMPINNVVSFPAFSRTSKREVAKALPGKGATYKDDCNFPLLNIIQPFLAIEIAKHIL